MGKMEQIIVNIHYKIMTDEIMGKDKRDFFSFNVASWIIKSMFTDIDKLAKLILVGYGYKGYDGDYERALKDKIEEIKKDRIMFAKHSPLVSHWADCVELDVNKVRLQIIKFVLSYPNVNALDFEG